MFTNLLFYLKWFKTFFQINYHKNWIQNTHEGKLYFKKILEDNGLLSIKLGQFLHSNSLILNFDNIFEDFLSDNKIHSLEYTKKTLGEYYDKISYLDDEVIGSGSFAQVYKCKFHNDPNNYVLKILHPEAKNSRYEINVLKNIFYYLNYFNYLNVELDGFFNAISKSNNLENESNNIAYFNNIFKDCESIEIPKVIHTSKDFIVMTYIEGNLMYKETNKSILKKGNFLLASSFYYSFINCGIYHGDLHQGNVIIKKNGDIGLVDFGIVNFNVYSDILYDFQKWMYSRTYEDAKKFLDKILIIKKGEKIKYIKIIKLILKETDTFSSSERQIFIKVLKQKLNNYNLEVKGELLNCLVQHFILEGNIKKEKFIKYTYMYTVFKFMKDDKFFYNNMSTNIDKLLKLEIDNNSYITDNTYDSS
jgi:predicted unusual protein kinase regulating ubiquinone biosynthesis (AarF/ABC1/UbiB family)